MIKKKKMQVLIIILTVAVAVAALGIVISVRKSNIALYNTNGELPEDVVPEGESDASTDTDGSKYEKSQPADSVLDDNKAKKDEKGNNNSSGSDDPDEDKDKPWKDEMELPEEELD